MAAMTRFWIDNREYSAPDSWLSAQMEARKAMGIEVTEAAINTLTYWAEQDDARRNDDPR